MRNKRFILVMAALVLTAAASFAVPQAKYRSPHYAAKLRVPPIVGYWKNRDVTRELNLNDLRFNFISEVVAKEFRSDLGERVLMLLIDAGNFHHPKVCFGGSGYTVHSVEDIEAKTPFGTMKAKALFMEKGRDSSLVVYWICINGKVVDWTRQKIDELWYTIFNKEKIGLMGRLDIPCRRETVGKASETARDLIKSLSHAMPAEDAVYLFGGKTNSQ